MTGSDLRFDLVVATLDRTDTLERLLGSLDEQTHRAFRVLIVDQNSDERLSPILQGHPDLEIVHLKSAIGLSRARNVALEVAEADVVAFPDDDCAYAPDLLERVARMLTERPVLDGVSGILSEASGARSERWPSRVRIVTIDDIWHAGCSGTIFLRRSLFDRFGRFDERMGFGSGNPWELAEEIDVLARVVLGGATIEQDPSIIVEHVHRTFAGAELMTYARQSGSGAGYVLGKNPFPPRMIVRMGVRPFGGMLKALAHADLDGAKLQLSILGWRIRGYRAGRRARSSTKSAA